MRKTVLAMNILLVTLIGAGLLLSALLSAGHSLREMIIFVIALSPYLVTAAFFLGASCKFVFRTAVILNALAIAIGIGGIAVFFLYPNRSPSTVLLGTIAIYLAPGSLNEWCLWANKAFKPTRAKSARSA